ncbi:MAG: NADH-quinone oxidoreductase subunit H [Dehalococcoidia bacterium]|nr:NADH-quinone oxidoreductase subunit H [Dehalococcoidia bacterium]
MSLTSVLMYVGLVVVFPGFVFTAVIGLLSSWFDRKLTARLQWRVGPPWYQGFADVFKLLGKETVLPQGSARLTFLGAPYIGLAAVIVVATIVWMASIRPDSGFIGDLIVVLYLLYVPSLALIVGGSASRNPFAALGASREMKLMLAYEVAFLLSVFTLLVKNGGIVSLGGMVEYQQAGGAMLSQGISCIIAFIVALIYVPAKLAMGPFDIPEAECELIAGPYTEYSGAPLAVFKITKAMLLCVMPVLLITLFATTAWSWWAILWYVLLLVVLVLIKNTNPRLRIDQALRFFWGPVLILSVVGIILATLGL